MGPGPWISNLFMEIKEVEVGCRRKISRDFKKHIQSAKQQHWHPLAAARHAEFQLQLRASKPKFVLEVDPWVIHMFIQVQAALSQNIYQDTECDVDQMFSMKCGKMLMRDIIHENENRAAKW